MTSFPSTDRALLNLLGRHGGVLTAGEAATRSGCPLAEVEPALLRLAVASGADLRVADDGTVAYRFAPHLRRRLLARSWRLRLEATISWLWRQLFGLIRISFGLVLVALLVVVSLVVLVVALLQILRSDDGVEGLLQLLWGALELLARILTLLFSDGFISSAAGPESRQEGGGGAQGTQQRGQGGTKRVDFFESVYSVLFGDGDPNHGLERRRWIRVGCFLQHRGGAVIAEDLAPLLDLPPRPADGERAAELADAAMLTVLQRFDGRPAVSEQGDLAFHFPSLQVQAAAPAGSGSRSRDDETGGATAELPPAPLHPAPALRERRVPFSRVSVQQRLLYAAMSGGLLLLSPVLLLVPMPPPLVALALFSMAYALLLLLVPLLRLLVLRWRNARIASRNARRRTWMRHNPQHGSLLQRKRRFAHGLARRRHLAATDLAYTTEQGLLEQNIDRASRG